MEWRRSKVVEMRARGLSQIEIARELQVSKASISSDIQYLCSQAKEYIKEYGIKIKDYHTTEIYWLYIEYFGLVYYIDDFLI